MSDAMAKLVRDMEYREKLACVTERIYQDHGATRRFDAHQFAKSALAALEDFDGRGVARHDPETSTPGFELSHNDRDAMDPATGKGAVENRESAPPVEEVLRALIHDYVQHDSWRCGHPDRWSQTADCPCGLLGALQRAGFDPDPWRVRES